MSNDLIVIQPEAAAITSKRGNYQITTTSGVTRELQRDVDFGNPKKANGDPIFPKPILYKSGAEKVIRDFKMFDRYTVVSAVEDAENGFFHYMVKCSLVAYNPQTGQEVVYTDGIGSANTRESKTGNQSGFDAANSTIKKAKKRAMVDAAVSLAALSSAFTMDLEDVAFMNAAVTDAQQKETDPITPKQRQRIFAIGSKSGMTTEQVKTWLKAEGYASVKDILLKDYDGICEKLGKAEVGNAN